jgi:F0F1-type ATP synthase gamma subunit
MANIKKIKDEMINTREAIVLLNSMLTVAKIKSALYKNKLTKLEYEIKKIGSLLHRLKFSFKAKETKRCFLFSDSGFCGNFNKFSVKTGDLSLGNKSYMHNQKTISTQDYWHVNTFLHKFIDSNYNINFIVNDCRNRSVREIDLNHFIQEYESFSENILIQIDGNLLKKMYILKLIQYVCALSILSENFYRSQVTHNAHENAREIHQTLQVNYNSERLARITNEIMLIIASYNSGE